MTLCQLSYKHGPPNPLDEAIPTRPTVSNLLAAHTCEDILALELPESHISSFLLQVQCTGRVVIS
ncbi:hypothetical protein N657DRAFT_642154 [Parathielavia appendiculata]|uniref:Uncharacterized protein n=1 Tax=Parathielavia appendiculata TaxID=2587402 RepID=A0AAN6U2T5_9PEZI|nr:hypothetical protein N657DRAFT_642154 [Parathielavia appendiculata]